MKVGDNEIKQTNISTITTKENVSTNSTLAFKKQNQGKYPSMHCCVNGQDMHLGKC